MGNLISSIDQDVLPPDYFRPQRQYSRRRIWWGKRRSCPYCLDDLTHYDPTEHKGLGYACPLCRHAILDHLLTTPLYQFTPSQRWDLLANEMEYIWKAEHRDVDSYLFGMGGYYNPDYGEAKERLFGMLAEKDALLELREEFILAEGELDLLMIGHLNKLGVWRGDMARRLFLGHPFRSTARRLSLTFPCERELAGFQLGLIQASPWGAFRCLEEKEGMVAFLADRLAKLSPGQSNWGA